MKSWAQGVDAVSLQETAVGKGRGQKRTGRLMGRKQVIESVIPKDSRAWVSINGDGSLVSLGALLAVPWGRQCRREWQHCRTESSVCLGSHMENNRMGGQSEHAIGALQDNPCPYRSSSCA